LVFPPSIPGSTAVLGDLPHSGSGRANVRIRWLVSPISWTLIAAVWGYNLAWMFVLGAVRLVTERFATYRTARHLKSASLVYQSLQPQVPPFMGAPAAQL
jgi:hypothetical protein